MITISLRNIVSEYSELKSSYFFIGFLETYRYDH